MSYIDSRSIAEIISRTLGHVDQRVVHHGKRVAYLVKKMLETTGTYDERTIRDICLIALAHDIGAYKTAEINDMLQFESDNLWDHSVYGYLFLKNLTPLSRYADIVLFHHTEKEKLYEINPENLELIEILRLADRVDVYKFIEGHHDVLAYLKSQAAQRFSSGALALFLKTEDACKIVELLCAERSWDEILDLFDRVPFTQEEIDMYIRMLVYTIDFRSRTTVIHTITTVRISLELARLLGLNPEETEQIRYGAVLHDLGKIGIPVEILEFPGKLSPQAMRVMKTHVTLTEEILDGRLDEKITKIAVRHHEKLDGSGYPRGLSGDQLTLPQRIVAVADMMSALSGARSYKTAFSKERILHILMEDSEQGKISPEVVSMVVDHYDAIMEAVDQNSQPVIAIYDSISSEYERLMKTCLAW
ncbi:MAG: HD domain-containing protein [Hungatella sp.]